MMDGGPSIELLVHISSSDGKYLSTRCHPSPLYLQIPAARDHRLRLVAAFVHLVVVVEPFRI